MIRLVLSDVDGMHVRSDKTLGERSIEAVAELHEARIRFSVTSGRPPRGMSMLVEPLDLEAPIAAFNGGLIVEPDLSVVEDRAVASSRIAETIVPLECLELSVWVYRRADWLVVDPDGPHVAHEAMTVGFEPKVVDSFDGIETGVAKIVGVSDDHDAVAAAEQKAHLDLGDHVSASRSQPYYLDITHPGANNGRSRSSCRGCTTSSPRRSPPSATCPTMC